LHLDLHSFPTRRSSDLQPNFAIPNINILKVLSGGNLTAGTVQFAFQYSDAAGNAYTSFYSVTNPLSLHDSKIVTPNFDYPVGKSDRKSTRLNSSHVKIS